MKWDDILIECSSCHQSESANKCYSLLRIHVIESKRLVKIAPLSLPPHHFGPHRDACEKRMMEKLTVVEHTWERPPLDPVGGDFDAGSWQGVSTAGEGGPTHLDDTLGGVLQLRWMEN